MPLLCACVHMCLSTVAGYASTSTGCIERVGGGEALIDDALSEEALIEEALNRMTLGSLQMMYVGE